MTKYLKVMFGNKGAAYEYKVNEINISNTWNPNTFDPNEMGGFNFSTEDKILRWLIRGDTLYDVIIPENTDIVDCPSESAPHGVFRSNKIIITNPRVVTDDVAFDLYLKSNLPEKSYYKSLAGCAIMGYKNTCLRIIKDKVNYNNIDLVLSEIHDFVAPFKSNNSVAGHDVYNEIMEVLNKIKRDKL